MRHGNPEAAIYDDRSGQKRWKVVHEQNGQKVGNGGQGYAKLRDLEQGMRDCAEGIARYFAAKAKRRARKRA